MHRFLLFFLVSCCFPASSYGQQQKSRPNILFIAVDDLRPDLGCYGNDLIHSPNLDLLASRAVVFRNQFVTVPTCGPSRFSLLTGRLPRSQQDLSNAIFEIRREDSADTVRPESMVEQFRRNGYYTVGIGKISHSPDGYIYGYTEPKGNELELPASWDEMLLDAGKWGTGWNAFFGYADGSNRNDRKKQVKPYEKGAVNDLGYPDGLTASLAIEKLQELAGKKQPFFLGIGFFKPHLPFNAPQKYWDLYEEANIPLTPSPGIPENVNMESLHGSAEFNQYQLGEERASLSQPLSDGYARKLKHAYFASVSYVDAQIGRVLDRLHELDLDKNTIIVVWGTTAGTLAMTGFGGNTRFSNGP
ncbi:sulfatase-like hydrolase/transferase [Anseongella ginsenosidimutans]|uniref:sulfatase-like hydrolase/transferase n=1 Tax=Anseongella ginsenosidimutans TaxID=496056 RepID=UPI001CEFA751|nr:sulfatase-like hydrolase/transferase [Anseongella ginsenosidimutans]